MIKVTLEFANVDEAIMQLARLSSAPLDTAAALVSVANNADAARERREKQAEPVTAAEVRAERDASGVTMADAKKAVEAKKSAAAPTAQALTPAPAASPSAAASPTVDYATLQKAVFALANASREAALEVMASFNVKTFKELSEDQWGAALTAVNEKLAKLKDLEAVVA